MRTPSWPVIVGLALLAVPRAVLHDLDLIQEGQAVNLLLVVVPLLAWLVVAVVARWPRPFPSMLMVGLAYGVLLALTHQLLWSANGGDDVTVGNLPPAAGQLVLRAFAAVSSLFTGLVTGAVVGLIAWGLLRLRGAR